MKIQRYTIERLRGCGDHLVPCVSGEVCLWADVVKTMKGALVPCPECEGDRDYRDAHGCETCADSELWGWVPVEVDHE